MPNVGSPPRRRSRGLPAGVVGMMLLISTALAGAQNPAGGSATLPGAPLPGIDISLRPERDSAGNVAAVGVTFHLTDTVSSSAATSFRAPIVLNNLPGIADRVDGFRIEDRNGAVPITTHDDSADASGFGYYRHWRTTRPLALPATVRYRAIVAPRRLRAGPPFDLRTFAGGVSGGGAGFLALPEDNRRYRVRIHWDLAGLERGSVGISSLG